MRKIYICLVLYFMAKSSKFKIEFYENHSITNCFSTLFLFILMQMLSVVCFFKQRMGFKGASLWEDSIEQVVDLPHTWNTEDAAEGYIYFRGEGNYSKNYFVDRALKESVYF